MGKYPKTDWKKVIADNEQHEYFLFSTLGYDRPYDFRYLIDIFNEKGITPNVIRKNQCNLLHYAANVETDIDKIFELIMSYPSVKINQINEDGDTPLHTAAQHGNVQLIEILLKNKADQTILNKDGKSWLEIASENPLCSKMAIVSDYTYGLFKASGYALKKKTSISKQNGLTCGIVSISCAANYFNTPIFFARKKDRIRTNSKTVEDKNSFEGQSLRFIAKRLGMSQIGEMLHAQQVAELIEKTNCSSITFDLSGDYEETLAIINKALQLDLLILIPFAINPDNNMPAVDKKYAIHPHWAVIVGSRKDQQGIDQLHILQWGRDYIIPAKTMHQACCMPKETKYPQTTFYKIKNNLDWSKEKPTHYIGINEIKERTISETALSDFYYKLIVVTSKGFNKKDLVDDSKERSNDPSANFSNG